MNMSEFRRAIAEEFGTEMGSVLLRDHWLRSFGATAEEALNEGYEVREVWLALCEELQIPPERRYGRGRKDPQNLL